MHTYFKFVLGIIFILISSCADEDPCPRCFEDIVTCKVNGKEWQSNCISHDPLFGCTSVGCYYYFRDDHSMTLNSIDDLANINIEISQSKLTGGLKIGNQILRSRDVRIGNRNQNGNCFEYEYLDSTFNNNLLINKIDTINYIIEGQFEFKVNNHCGDTATITDGHFKTKFIY